MTNDHTETILTSKWFVVVDDVTGGWAIATVDKPLSEINFREPGVYVVADMISLDMASYVVHLHERERLS